MFFRELFCRVLRIGAPGTVLLLLAVAAPAQVVTEFSTGISAGAAPTGITAGPDGNLWFTEQGGDRIGRITPLGVVTEFSAGITAGAVPSSIAAGPDGNLWFTEFSGNRIGKITPFGVVTEFSAGITASAGPIGITAGPDGNLWFTELNGNRIGQITPLGVVTEFAAGITTGAAPAGITAGPDGNLWFAERNGNRIGKITPLGVVTEFAAGITAGATTIYIAAGADGNLWFTELNGNRIGKITPLGVVTEFAAGITAGALLAGIAAGPDGNLWFTELVGNRIGRITPLGVVDEFSAGITANAQPFGIAAGPDGNLWFAESNGDRIGQITVGVFVSSISPSSGPASGFSGAVIAGGNFAAGATVTVGGAAASGVIVDSATQITMDVPPLAPGGVYPVTVTDPGPSSGTLTSGWFADFLDVPGSLPIHPFVEKLARNAITAGCGGGNYCPGSSVTRAQMAVFLLRSNDGPAYTPPACVAPAFNDVPCSSGFAIWVNELAARSVTAGCGGGNYCPNTPVTRDQMAVFLLRTKEGSAYTPPACVVPTFADVPCSSGFAVWVNELAARGITAGCGGGNYCPGTAVTRGQMAVFLSTTFALP